MPLAVRFLVTGENSGGTVAVFEVVVPAGQRLMAPAHSHDHYEETIYGVEGVLTWTVDGKVIDAGAGAGALHSSGRCSPVRQQRRRGREGVVRHHAGRNRPAIFSRDGGGGQRGGRGSAGPREDVRDHASPRADSGSASASGVGLRCVWKVGLPEFCARCVAGGSCLLQRGNCVSVGEASAGPFGSDRAKDKSKKQPQVLRLRGPRGRSPLRSG